jgi:creatinine amidohydrolase
VPTGGSEQNGPHIAIGKHNRIVRHCAGAIADRLGNALIAPVLAYVPEGSFDPPDGNMAFPGTIGVSEPAFAAILRGAALSLALAGFKLICFIGDHGLSQAAQTSAAASLARLWLTHKVRVVSLTHYYSENGQEKWLLEQGFTAAEIGRHAGLLDTAELMAIAPRDIREALLSSATWPAGATGVEGDPTRASAAIGARLLELKIDAAVAQARGILKEMAAAGRG